MSSLKTLAHRFTKAIYLVSAFCLVAATDSQPGGNAQLVVQRYSVTTPRFFTLSSDGERAIMIRGDDYGHRFGYEVLRAKDGKLLQSGALPDFNLLAHGYGVSPSLNYLIYCGKSVPAQVIDLRSASRIINIKSKDEGFCYGAAVSDDGNAVLLYGDYAEHYSLNETGGFHFVRKLQMSAGSWNNLTAISSDNKLLAHSNYDGKITVVNLSDFSTVFTKSSSFLFMGSHGGHLQYLQFSADGHYLTSRDSDTGKLFVHTRDGSKVASTKVATPLLYLNPSDHGSPEPCLSQKISAAKNKEYVFCLPTSAKIDFTTSSDRGGSVSIGGLEKQFALSQYLRPQFVGKIDHKSMELLADNGKAARQISLEGIGLEAKEKIHAKSYDGIHFAISHDTKPDPDWLSAKKYFAVKIEGDKATLLVKHRISITTGDFAPMTPGTLGYSAWYTIQRISAAKPTGTPTERSAGDNMHYNILDFDPISQTLIGISGNRIVLWDKSGKVVAEGGEAAKITDLRMSRTGEMFITAAEDNTVSVWKSSNLAKLITFLQADDGWVAAAADGRYEFAGSARELLHYAANGEIIPLTDFDNSFLRKNLLAEVLSGKVLKPALPTEAKTSEPQEISKKLKGKIHSVATGEVTLGGTGFLMGERVFVVVRGKPIYLKVHFPSHTGAKAKTEKGADQKMLRAGMPVFR